MIADGLHMSDWGYACFAQLLGDDIIKSVGQIKLGVNVPADVPHVPADVRRGTIYARRSQCVGWAKAR